MQAQKEVKFYLCIRACRLKIFAKPAIIKSDLPSNFAFVASIQCVELLLTDLEHTQLIHLSAEMVAGYVSFGVLVRYPEMICMYRSGRVRPQVKNERPAL